jgi:hypothetical protein
MQGKVREGLLFREQEAKSFWAGCRGYFEQQLFRCLRLERTVFDYSPGWRTSLVDHVGPTALVTRLITILRVSEAVGGASVSHQNRSATLFFETSVTGNTSPTGRQRHRLAQDHSADPAWPGTVHLVHVPPRLARPGRLLRHQATVVATTIERAAGTGSNALDDGPSSTVTADADPTSRARASVTWADLAPDHMPTAAPRRRRHLQHRATKRDHLSDKDDCKSNG